MPGGEINGLRTCDLPPHPALTTYVIAGVSGSGKSTVGQALADRLGSAFFDGDDFHSDSNKAKMRSGQPLTDEDRRPWLASLAAAIQQHASSDKPTVFACSALKRKYRDVLAARATCDSPAHVLFVVLQPPVEVLRKRLAARWAEGRHFMPPSQLDAQMADLEVDAPAADEAAQSQSAGGGGRSTEAALDAAPMLVLKSADPPARLVDAILQFVATMGARR